MNKNARCWRVKIGGNGGHNPEVRRRRRRLASGALRSWNRRKCRRFANQAIGTGSEHAGQRWSCGTGHCATFPWRPLHGHRSLLVSFNYFNATAGRSNFRQATWSKSGSSKPSDQGHHLWGAGEVNASKIQQIHFSGIHGTFSWWWMGSIAAPFIGHKVQGVVLSGAGSGISIRRSIEQLMTTYIQDLLRETFQLRTMRNSMNSTLCWA